MTLLPLLFQKLGWPEILLIAGVILLILGPTQIPKLTKMFGKSVKGFKEGMEEAEEEVDDKPKKKVKKAVEVESDNESDEE